MAIIDSFTYFNEEKLLKFRLDYLWNTIDRFVLVEASHTQSGLNKPFYFEDNKHKFEKYLDKIIHIQVEELPGSGGWSMENLQRNSIIRGLTQFNHSDSLLISDLDEIPCRESILKASLLSSINLTTISLSQIYCAYYMNLACLRKTWYGTILTNVHDAVANSPQVLRNNKDNMAHYDGFGGWHFSWLSGVEAFKTKIKSCVEPSNKLLDFDELEKIYKNSAAKRGGHFIHCENPYDRSVPLEELPFDMLPSLIQENPDKYKEFLLP